MGASKLILPHKLIAFINFTDFTDFMNYLFVADSPLTEPITNDKIQITIQIQMINIK